MNIYYTHIVDVTAESEAWVLGALAAESICERFIFRRFDASNQRSEWSSVVVTQPIANHHLVHWRYWKSYTTIYIDAVVADEVPTVISRPTWNGK